MIGDWMGALYGVGGRRCDHHLFLDHDGRYERTVRCEPDYELSDSGRWTYDEGEKLLHLHTDTLDDSAAMFSRWWVLSVSTCEDSNILLVLREAILGSRNLPILFYRVHCSGRAYGSNWEERRAREEIDRGT